MNSTISADDVLLVTVMLCTKSHGYSYITGSYSTQVPPKMWDNSLDVIENIRSSFYSGTLEPLYEVVYYTVEL